MEYAEEAAPRSKSMFSGSAAPMPAMEAEDSEGAMRSAGVADDKPVDEADGSDGIEQQRKRVYNGSARLIVEDTEESRRDLEDLARDSGGYVESSYADYVVLRIPAERFDEIFSVILKMGSVEYSRVETWDVTEAFADITRRLDTAEETRARLYVLLDKSTDPAERARILKEIGRLTEEIESLRQQLTVMEARVAYSRITVQLTPRIQGDSRRYEIPFPWIAYLDPLSPAGSSLRARLDVDLGDDFAVFDKENVFMAESSEGVQVLVSTVDNVPRGDSDFWHKALVHHLGPYYASVAEKTIFAGDKEILGVEFVSKDREPFKYFVGVLVDGRKIHVVEVFSPDGAADFSPIYTAFAEGALK